MSAKIIHSGPIDWDVAKQFPNKMHVGKNAGGIQVFYISPGIRANVQQMVLGPNLSDAGKKVFFIEIEYDVMELKEAIKNFPSISQYVNAENVVESYCFRTWVPTFKEVWELVIPAIEERKIRARAAYFYHVSMFPQRLDDCFRKEPEVRKKIKLKRRM